MCLFTGNKSHTVSPRCLKIAYTYLRRITNKSPPSKLSPPSRISHPPSKGSEKNKPPGGLNRENTVTTVFGPAKFFASGGERLGNELNGA